MRIAALLMFVFLTAVSHADQTRASVNEEIKRKLQSEIKGMQNDMLQLDISVRNLKEDKLEIQRDLDKVKEWGVAQQKEKFEYYENAAKLNEQLVKSEKSQEELKEKYRRLKNIMGYVAGGLLVLIYFRFAQTPYLIGLLGPYAPIATFAGPVFIFGLGYLTVKLYF